MNPEEAVQAHMDVGARRSIGMHFGTFRRRPKDRMSRWPRSAVRGPLPESTMPPSRRSTSVNPRASERLTAADQGPKSADRFETAARIHERFLLDSPMTHI